MSKIIALRHANKEVMSNFLRLLNDPNTKESDGSMVNNCNMLQSFSITKIEENKDWELYSVEYFESQITIEALDSKETPKPLMIDRNFTVQVHKQDKVAQVTSFEYQEDCEEIESIKLPNDYQDYRVHEELNLLFENVVACILDDEEVSNDSGDGNTSENEIDTQSSQIINNDLEIF
jgi:phosphoribosylanthranilate isomerase